MADHREIVYEAIHAQVINKDDDKNALTALCGYAKEIDPDEYETKLLEIRRALIAEDFNVGNLDYALENLDIILPDDEGVDE